MAGEMGPGIAPVDPSAPTLQNPPVLGEISCSPGDEPTAPTPLKRLSKVQYRNAANNVFNINGGQGLGSEIAKDVLTNYALIPEDSRVVPNTGIKTAITGFDRTDSTISQYHTDGAFFVGLASASSFIKNAGWVRTELQAAASAMKLNEECGGATVTHSCVRAFIAAFGRRALRRPLTAAELDDYAAMYDELSTGDYRDGLAGVVTRFLMAPQFLYQVETEGTPIDGRSDMLALSPYELAARLSFALHDDMPDAALDRAADDGSLMTEAGYTAEVEALMHGKDRTQDVVGTFIAGDAGSEFSPYQLGYSASEIVIDGFFNQWLKVYANKSFEYSNLSLQALADYYRPAYLGGAHHQHFISLTKEVVSLYSFYTWIAKGTFADLMTTDKLAYTGTDPELLFDQPAWGTPDRPPFWNQPEAPPMPSYPPGERDGLLTRPFFLMSGNELTNPVRRGVFIQRQILCNALPSPDPNALPDRALEPPAVNPTATMRERFATKTSPALCQTCHQLINPTGFAFESYDALGRARTNELTFGADHRLAASPVVDSTASVPIGDKTVDVANGSQLMHAIAVSKVANECFARQYFRFVFGRTEGEGDGCTLSGLYDASTKSGMLAMFKRVTQEPGFKLHRVGPQ